jgi:hypothetical protein
MSVSLSFSHFHTHFLLLYAYTLTLVADIFVHMSSKLDLASITDL